MASASQILEVRNNVNQPTNAEPYTDVYIGGMIDVYGIDEASARIWDQKAAAVAGITDISEGGSSRKSPHAQYLLQAERFRSSAIVEETTSRAPRTRESVRQ